MGGTDYVVCPRVGVRRAGLRGLAGGAAFILAAVVVGGPNAAGQTAPPVDDQAKILVVQSARSGSLVPTSGSDNEFTLTLRGVGDWALWFSDRPARESGHLPHRVALDLIGFGEHSQNGPPNAVLSVPGEREDHNMLAVTLHDPKYEPKRGTLQYRVTRLPDVAGTRLEGYASQVDKSLPRQFDDAALFIDDTGANGGCEVTIHFRHNAKVIFLNVQDVLPTLDSFKGIPAAGQEFASGSDLTVTNEVYGLPSYWCRMGMVFRTIEPTYGQSLFVYFNNPLSAKSSWGCGTVPPGWKCTFEGNESGQPLRLQVTIN